MPTRASRKRGGSIIQLSSIYGVVGQDLNVYKGTKNYLGSETDPCPPNNWITQLKGCFNDFGTVQFYMVNPLKEKIDDWDGVANIHYITIDEMWKRLNR